MSRLPLPEIARKLSSIVNMADDIKAVATCDLDCYSLSDDLQDKALDPYLNRIADACDVITRNAQQALDELTADPEPPVQDHFEEFRRAELEAQRRHDAEAARD